MDPNNYDGGNSYNGGNNYNGSTPGDTRHAYEWEDEIAGFLWIILLASIILAVIGAVLAVANFVLCVIFAVKSSQLPKDAPGKTMILVAGIIGALFGISIVGVIFIGIANTKAKNEEIIGNLITVQQGQQNNSFEYQQQFQNDLPNTPKNGRSYFVNNFPSEVYIKVNQGFRPIVNFIDSDTPQSLYSPSVMVDEPITHVYVLKNKILYPKVVFVFDDGHQEYL